MRQLLTIAVFIACAYALVCVLAYVFQSRMVFFPDRKLVAKPSAVGLAFEDVAFTTADDVEIHGWFLPREGAAHTLLFCHGNAGNISHRFDSLRIFHELGLSVLIFDYRGYGRSAGGPPSETGTYRDADAAYRYLIDERGVDPSRLIVFGRSLGSGVAIELASRMPVGALIAESSFTSLPDVGQRAYPILPVKLLSRIRYDSASRVASIAAPKLFVHSRDDELIPFALGRRLFDEAAEPKHFVEIQGDHNSGFATSGAQYTAALRAFLESL